MSDDPAGVSLNATVGVTDPGNGGGTITRVAEMTAVDVLGRVDELTDGAGGSVDAVIRSGNRSISGIPAQSHPAADGGVDGP